MFKRKTGKGVEHKNRNVSTEALLGMNEVSKHVEHIVRGPRMLNLLEGTRGGGGSSLPNLTVVGTTEVSNPGHLSQIQSGLCETVQNNLAGALLSLKVTRNTRNITEVLPVPLFSPLNIVENYASIFGITQTLPAGITVAVSVFNNRSLRFTYTQGLNVDTIDVINTAQVPYPVIQEMLKTDWFTALGMKYTAGTGNFNAQFNALQLAWGRQAFRGIQDTDSVSLPSFMSRDQFIQNLMYVDATMFFNSRRYLIVGMADTVVDPGDETIQLDFILDEYASSVDILGATICRNAN